MRRMVFIVCLVLALLLHRAAQGEPVPETPLTLHEALDIALAQQPTLRIGQATIEAARQRVRQQIAGYLPRGGYLYNYTRKQQAVNAAVGGIQAGQQPRATAQLFNFNSTNFT